MSDLTVPSKRPEPTVSSADERLYSYTNEDAPDDVVINVGQSPLMVSAPASVNDPHRMEVGDRRRGPYYLECVGKMPGLMPLNKVDPARIAQVNKIREVRVGLREPDWVTEARKRSADGGGESYPLNPHSDATPLQRAAQGI